MNGYDIFAENVDKLVCSLPLHDLIWLNRLYGNYRIYSKDQIDYVCKKYDFSKSLFSGQPTVLNDNMIWVDAEKDKWLLVFCAYPDFKPDECGISGYSSDEILKEVLLMDWEKFGKNTLLDVIGTD